MEISASFQSFLSLSCNAGEQRQWCNLWDLMPLPYTWDAAWSISCLATKTSHLLLSNTRQGHWESILFWWSWSRDLGVERELIEQRNLKVLSHFLWNSVCHKVLQKERSWWLAVPAGVLDWELGVRVCWGRSCACLEFSFAHIGWEKIDNSSKH